MQKQLVTLALAFAVVPFFGCNTSPTGGGAGEGTFKVTGPTTAVNVKQGETQKETLSISKDNDFKSDITFTADSPPKGVTVEFSPKTVKASEKAETSMSIKVAKDAPTGDGTIKVTAKPEKGKETSLDVKVKIEESK